MTVERRYTRLSGEIKSERKEDGFRGRRSRQCARMRDDDETRGDQDQRGMSMAKTLKLECPGGQLPATAR